MFSVFFDPNFTGVLFVLFFIFLLSHIFNAKKNGLWTRSRLFHVAIAVFTGVAILLTYSRTAIITLIASVIVFFVTKQMYKMLLLLLCILFLFLFVSSDIKIEGLNPFRTVSAKARVESMQIATKIIEKNIFFGVGFNAYRFAQHRYGYRVSGEWETSHADAGTDNSFLFVFATSGIFGLFSYIFLLYAIFKLPVQKENKPLLYASMTGLCASALFLNTLFYPFVLLWTWTLFALMENT
jgi:O-antigen ligase